MSGPGFDERAWVGEALRITLEEVRQYLRTLLGVSFGPARFVDAWSSGARTMNPLGFVASSAAITALLKTVYARRAGIEDNATLAADALRAIGPHVVLGCVGLLAHVLFRAAGSRRRPAGSVAIALFAGAGPALFTSLFILGIGLLSVLHNGYDPKRSFLQNLPPRSVEPFMLTVYASMVWQYVTLGRALHALHRVRWSWTVLALLVAVVAEGVAFGFLHQVAKMRSVGWLHPSLWRTPAGVSIDFFL